MFSPIKRTSLFWRLMLAMGAILLAGSVILGYLARNYARKAADDAYDKLLLGSATQIAETIRADADNITVQVPASALETLSNGGLERIYYNVIAPQGQSVTGYDGLRVETNRPERTILQVWDTDFKSFPIRALALQHPVAGATAPSLATVVVAQTRDAREALTRQLTLNATLMLAVISLLALASTAVAALYALRPLRRIENQLLLRDPNDLTPLDENVPSEIRELAQSINHFMGRLAERIDAMQRFIADAAHQIRTPVTALSAQVNLLQHETKAAARKRRLHRVVVRTRQIGRLVNQLLTKAVVLHRAQAAKAELIDLVDVVKRAIRDVAPRNESIAIPLRIASPDRSVPVMGDSVTLAEALRNIIENAIKHGNARKVHVTIEINTNTARVHVDDAGPGIPTSLQAAAALPFSRLSDKGDGSGLGLAIASDVAKAHGGGLSFARTPAGHFRVTLEISVLGKAE